MWDTVPWNKRWNCVLLSRFSWVFLWAKFAVPRAGRRGEKVCLALLPSVIRNTWSLTGHFWGKLLLCPGCSGVLSLPYLLQRCVVCKADKSCEEQDSVFQQISVGCMVNLLFPEFYVGFEKPSSSSTAWKEGCAEILTEATVTSYMMSTVT